MGKQATQAGCGALPFQSAARELLHVVATREFEGHRLRVRIGIATGPVAAGTVGSVDRQTYTVYGDTVNLAQRLERLNKELATDCLLCGTTFLAAQPDCADAVSRGSRQVPGRDAPVEVYSLGRVYSGGGTPETTKT